MLKGKKRAVDVNTNPLAFEELAVSLASLATYIDCQKENLGMRDPIEEFQHLYTRALQEPPSYREITEFTGQSLSSLDRRASRAAWLLRKVIGMEICSVHEQLWHRIGKKYSIPLLDQLSRVLYMERKVADKDLQAYGARIGIIGVGFSPLDVVGIKKGEIYLVQSLHRMSAQDQDVRLSQANEQRFFGFGGKVFEKVIFKGSSFATICNAYDVIVKAFPRVKITPMVLVMHHNLPIFELYRINLDEDRREEIKLSEELIVLNSIQYKKELEENQEWLWVLSERLDNELFKGLPPCRGGRTLNILASICKRQVKSEKLLVCKEKEVCNMLREDYNLELPRDKLRHDLVDRLVGQGFMRKWGSEYSVTVKGMARYYYCLAKYTTLGTDDPQCILDACVSQRNKIIRKYGCV